MVIVLDQQFHEKINVSGVTILVVQILFTDLISGLTSLPAEDWWKLLADVSVHGRFKLFACVRADSIKMSQSVMETPIQKVSAMLF